MKYEFILRSIIETRSYDLRFNKNKCMGIQKFKKHLRDSAGETSQG